MIQTMTLFKQTLVDYYGNILQTRCKRERHAELYRISYCAVVYDLTLRYGHPACALKVQFTYGAIESRCERLTLYSFRRGTAVPG